MNLSIFIRIQNRKHTTIVLKKPIIALPHVVEPFFLLLYDNFKKHFCIHPIDGSQLIQLLNNLSLSLANNIVWF